MSKLNRKTWIIYGGVIGAIVCSVLALLFVAGAKYFVPHSAHSVHMSWALVPSLLWITIISGFMLGGWIGNDIAPKTVSERVQYVKEVLFGLVVIGVCQLILHSLWDKPEAKDKFWVSLAWDMGPIFLPFYLWKLLSRRKCKTAG